MTEDEMKAEMADLESRYATLSKEDKHRLNDVRLCLAIGFNDLLDTSQKRAAFSKFEEEVNRINSDPATA